jgi:hypothetical protein
MFQWGRQNRKPNPVAKPRVKGPRATSRRLGFELMEGRMMLSAAPFQLAPIELQLFRTTSDSLSYDTESYAGKFTLAPAVPSDGGFLSTDALQSFGATASLNFSNDVPSLSVLDNYISRGAVANLSTNLDMAGISLTGSAIKMTGGIQPMVITSDGTGGNLRAAIAPVHQNNIAQTGDSDHGGTISVETLLPAAGRAADYQSAPPSRNEYVDHSSTQRLISTRLDSVRVTAASPLAGEWARSMIFETAGGDPMLQASATKDGFGLPAILDDDANSSLTKPLTNVDMQPNGAQSSAKTTGLHGPIGAVESAAMERLDAILFQGIDRESIRSSILELLNLERTTSDNHHPKAAETSDLDAVKALQSLMDKQQTAVPLGEEKAQMGSLDAIPFVIALSLERLINHRSRRARDRETAVVQKPPRATVD